MKSESKPDILDPAAVAKRMKELNLHRDEPFPPPKPPETSKEVIEDESFYFGFNFLDYRP